METEAMEQGRLSAGNGEEAAALATEYWIPGCAGMTSEYGDEAGYGECVSHISSNML